MADLYGIDARSGERLEPPVPETTPAGVAEACGAAADAARGLSLLPLNARAEALRTVADELEVAAKELVALADAETGLGESALQAELHRTTAQLRLLADEVLRPDFVAARSEEGRDGAPGFHRMLVPIGPVAVYAASNFPFALSVAGSDTAAALAAGCPVVVKAHPGHPGTSRRTAEIVAAALRESGTPEGCFAVVHGMAAGQALVADPRIRAAAFTGSQAGGRALFDAACARPDPIPFYGELGSVNPVFVSRAAVAARGAGLVSGFATSFARYAGQLCTHPGLVFLPAGHGLRDALVAALGALEAAPLLNARVRAGFREGVDRLAGCAETLLAVPDGPHLFRCSAEEFWDRPELSEECFGPASVLVEYAAEEQLPHLAERVPGSLTATVHAEPDDAALVHLLLPALSRRAGRVVWNGWPTGVAVNRTMHHGGPWPATTSAQHTSIGTESVRRFQVPVVFQDLPRALLPAPLRTAG